MFTPYPFDFHECWISCFTFKRKAMSSSTILTFKTTRESKIWEMTFGTHRYFFRIFLAIWNFDFFVYCHEYQITAHPYGVEFHQYPCIGFRLRHFRCKEFYPLVLWIWNQNIAISTIVGTSSHTNILMYAPYLFSSLNPLVFHTYLNITKLPFFHNLLVFLMKF